MLKSLTSALLICMTSASVFANVEIQFRDGAPKDKFTISNNSQCTLQDIQLNIDLTDSLGALIFDTTASGQGVEVYQPFEVTKGSITLASTNTVKDGDKQLPLFIQSIQANETASFTIDVDDTLTNSELGNIRVTSSEIANGTASLTLKGSETIKATFDNNGKAMVSIANCPA